MISRNCNFILIVIFDQKVLSVSVLAKNDFFPLLWI